MIWKHSQSQTALQFLVFDGAMYEGTPGGNIYWNVAYTTFIILYVNTKICSNFEVTILYTGLIC